MDYKNYKKASDLQLSWNKECFDWFEAAENIKLRLS